MHTIEIHDNANVAFLIVDGFTVGTIRNFDRITKKVLIIGKETISFYNAGKFQSSYNVDKVDKFL